MSKYAAKPTLAKALFEYIFHHENDIRNVSTLFALLIVTNRHGLNILLVFVFGRILALIFEYSYSGKNSNCLNTKIVHVHICYCHDLVTGMSCSNNYKQFHCTDLA